MIHLALSASDLEFAPRALLLLRVFAIAPKEFGPGLCELLDALEIDATRFKDGGSLKLGTVHTTH
jgi:hypothetical protein